jgi:hypothetical protein
LWPTRETGIGHHLLDRNLGHLLDPGQIRSISAAFDDGEDPGIPLAEGSARDPDYTDADRMMVDHWTELCFNPGGAEEGLFLDADKVRAAGGTARIVGEVLGLGPEEIRPLMMGVTPIDEDPLNAVAQSLGVQRESLVGDDPLADVVVDLAQPRFKRQIQVRATEAGIGEGDLRRAARREFALVARNDGDALRETKLRDAINRAGRTG